MFKEFFDKISSQKTFVILIFLGTLLVFISVFKINDLTKFSFEHNKNYVMPTLILGFICVLFSIIVYYVDFRKEIHISTKVS